MKLIDTLNNRSANVCRGYFNGGSNGGTTLRLSISGTWLGLPEELVSELLGRATSHHLKAGDTLFQIGDVGDGCYRLDKGLLKVTLTSSQAEERIVAVLASGAIVGDLAMIDGLPRSASVIAVTDCELRFISRTAFQHLARHHPEIYRHLVEVLAARLREADKTIASLAFLTVKGRVARALLELAENLGEQAGSAAILVPPMFHQRELAAMAGVARESVSRILSDFERQRLVTKSGRCFQIEDTAKLEREIDW